MGIIKIDTKGNITESKLEGDTIQYFYKLINCEFIEIVKPVLLYGLFGCNPEPTRTQKAVCMIVDEEGYMNDKKTNWAGSYLYGSLVNGHMIVGDVALAGLEWTPDGIEICNLDEHEHVRLLNALKAELGD